MSKIFTKLLAIWFKINVIQQCELDICIGKKRGYSSDDGTVDKDAFEKTISEDFPGMPTLIKAVKDNCLTGDLDVFGPPDACELVKLKHCVHMQAVNVSMILNNKIFEKISLINARS